MRSESWHMVAGVVQRARVPVPAPKRSALTFARRSRTAVGYAASARVDDGRSRGIRIRVEAGSTKWAVGRVFVPSGLHHLSILSQHCDPRAGRAPRAIGRRAFGVGLRRGRQDALRGDAQSGVCSSTLTTVRCCFHGRSLRPCIPTTADTGNSPPTSALPSPPPLSARSPSGSYPRPWRPGS